jgi:hypothetical protein
LTLLILLLISDGNCQRITSLGCIGIRTQWLCQTHKTHCHHAAAGITMKVCNDVVEETTETRKKLQRSADYASHAVLHGVRENNV